MWLLHFLPDSLLAFVVNTVLVLGIVGFGVSFFFGYVAEKFPQLIPHRMIIQVVSIVLLVAGVYFKGGQSAEMQWRERVRELEAKVAIAEQQSKEANVALEEKTKEKIQVVREKQIVIQEKIRDVQVKVDSQCKITTEVIEILNDAAKGAKK
jgi:uncharacterized coiled-coil protein SlyX